MLSRFIVLEQLTEDIVVPITENNWHLVKQ